MKQTKSVIKIFKDDTRIVVVRLVFRPEEFQGRAIVEFYNPIAPEVVVNSLNSLGRIITRRFLDVVMQTTYDDGVTFPDGNNSSSYQISSAVWEKIIEWLRYQAIENTSFQDGVRFWFASCFSDDAIWNVRDRMHRFLEESLELVQSLDLSKEEAFRLVEYVYNRDIGESFQEVGGVMTTLSALCSSVNINMAQAGRAELKRISMPESVKKIRAKDAAKPKFKTASETPFQWLHDHIGDIRNALHRADIEKVSALLDDPEFNQKLSRM